MKIQVDWERYKTNEQQELLYQFGKSQQLSGIITDTGRFIHEIVQREQLASTIVASNLAIPHVRSSNVLHFRIEVVKLTTPLKDWEGYQGIDRLIFTLVPLKMSICYQQECKQFFLNLGRQEVLNLFSHGSQKDLKDYLREKR